MTRNGNYDIAPTSIEIDKLNYTYDSYNVNRLIKVTDLTNSPLGFSDGANNANEYDYDGHGNMIRDDNKGITGILYNHLNLPTQITFSGATTRKIQYLYNAVGSKQKKVVTDGTVITTTDYLSGFQYQNNVLEFFPHAEGYVKYTEGYFNYVFNYTDHLGNVRLSYAKDPNGGTTRIMEENHYYPFGLKQTNYDNGTQRFMRAIGPGDVPVIIAPDIFGSGSYKYKFGKKELQDEIGLNVYDYGARNYDPALGRWMNIDPLAENSRRWTPYNYAYNNPMYFVDPDGMQADVWKNKLGQQVYNPKLNGGKGGYTKYATATEKKYGNALRNSGDKGAEQFSTLVNSTTEVEVEFHSGDNGTALGHHPGQTDIGYEGNGYTTDSATGNVTLEKATIDIYVGSADNLVKDINSGAVDTSGMSNIQKENVAVIKDNNLTGTDVATAIFGHEIDHLKPDNVKIQAQEKTGKSTGGKNSEVVPQRTENIILKDLAK